MTEAGGIRYHDSQYARLLVLQVQEYVALFVVSVGHSPVVLPAASREESSLCRWRARETARLDQGAATKGQALVLSY